MMNAKPHISDIYLASKKNFTNVRLASIDQTQTSSAMNMKSMFLNSNKSSIMNRMQHYPSSRFNNTMFVFP